MNYYTNLSKSTFFFLCYNVTYKKIYSTLGFGHTGITGPGLTPAPVQAVRAPFKCLQKVENRKLQEYQQ